MFEHGPMSPRGRAAPPAHHDLAVLSMASSSSRWTTRSSTSRCPAWRPTAARRRWPVGGHATASLFAGFLVVGGRLTDRIAPRLFLVSIIASAWPRGRRRGREARCCSPRAVPGAWPPHCCSACSPDRHDLRRRPGASRRRLGLGAAVAPAILGGLLTRRPAAHLLDHVRSPGLPRARSGSPPSTSARHRLEPGDLARTGLEPGDRDARLGTDSSRADGRRPAGAGPVLARARTGTCSPSSSGSP